MSNYNELRIVSGFGEFAINQLANARNLEDIGNGELTLKNTCLKYFIEDTVALEISLEVFDSEEGLEEYLDEQGIDIYEFKSEWFNAGKCQNKTIYINPVSIDEYYHVKGLSSKEIAYEIVNGDYATEEKIKAAKLALEQPVKKEDLQEAINDKVEELDVTIFDTDVDFEQQIRNLDDLISYEKDGIKYNFSNIKLDIE